jgi:hypothetical protein
MTCELDNHVSAILNVCEEHMRRAPADRAFALRALEEAVELALACGASVRDAHSSVEIAFRNERIKNVDREYDEERIKAKYDIAGEIADVCLLALCVARVDNISDKLIESSAYYKVERLRKASEDGELVFTSDGRFYPRK